MLQARQSLPIHARKFSLGLFAGPQLLRGRTTRARVYLAALGPRVGRSRGQQPTAHSPQLPTLLRCSSASTRECFADGYTLAEVMLWVFSGADFGLGSRDARIVHPASGLGVDLHKSEHPSEEISQASAS